MASSESDLVTTEPDPARAARDIEWKSPELVCPECGTCTISLLLRHDPVRGDWRYFATCHACGRQFDPNALRTFGESLDEMARQVEDERCRTCKGRQLGIRSFCDPKARRCFFLIHCESCGDVWLA